MIDPILTMLWVLYLAIIWGVGLLVATASAYALYILGRVMMHALAERVYGPCKRCRNEEQARIEREHWQRELSGQAPPSRRRG